MFQRQSRQSFPARNIIILAALVLAGLLYLLKSLEEKPKPEPDPDPIFLDSSGVGRDTLQRGLRGE